MAYTHDFDIEINGMTLEGEIDFGNGQPKVNFTDPVPELEIKELKKFTELFESWVGICKKCGNITKIEIVTKP